MKEITPFIDTTTNKANYPFWPANVAKPPVDGKEMHLHSKGVDQVMKSSALPYNTTTHY